MRAPNLALLFVLLLAPVRADAGPDDAVARLVAQLDAPDDRARERAGRQLIDLGEAALPALRERLERGGARAEDCRELIDRIEARRALREAEKTDERSHEKVVAEERLLRLHWQAFVIRYVEAKIEQAEDLGHGREYDKALALLDALLLVEPKMPQPLSLRVDKLRRELKAKRFRKSTVAGAVEVPRSVFRWGESIRLSFTITNNGDHEFALGAGVDESRPSTIRVQTSVRDYTLYGQARTSAGTHDVAMAERDVRLAPGQSWRKAWTVELPPRPAGSYIYREVTISSRALPTRMSVPGKLLDQLVVQFPEQRFRFFPAGYEQHAAKPLASLSGALRLDQPEAAFVAALLVPPHRHKEAIELLVDGIGRRRGMMVRTSVALLERLTGERLARAETWPLWWKAHRERFVPRER